MEWVRRWFGKAPTACGRTVSALGVERLEPRNLFTTAPAPIRVGMIYIEQDIGSDIHGDHFEIVFSGGAAQTQLARLVIDADQGAPGRSESDLIFDTTTGTGLGNTNYGADLSYAFELISHEGIEVHPPQVIDGTSLLVLTFSGFDAGERLTFSIDVDEIEQFDPAETNVQILNEGLDPLTSGVEFQGSILTALFTAPHYHPVDTEGEFRNLYDRARLESGLDLPEDNTEGKRDRTAGAFGQARQTPLPVSVSGTVFEDRNLDARREPNETGIADVVLSLWQADTSGNYTNTGHTAQTNAQGRYEFGRGLNLLPGEYQVRQMQPAGWFSVAAIPGSLSGSPVGDVVSGDPDILTRIVIPLGDMDAIDLDFAEARPVEIHGSVYHDRNQDGLRAANEEGIESSEIEVIPIRTFGPSRPISIRTNAAGEFSASGLAPGTYRLVQTRQPAGFRDGLDAPGQVNGVTRGRAVNPGDRIEDILLESGARGVQYLFGEYQPVSLRGRVQAASRDGDCFTPGVEHPPLAGVRVELLDRHGQVVAKTHTGADGQYVFLDIEPGQYSLREHTPPGFLQGGQQTGTVAGRPTGRVLGEDLLGEIGLSSGEQAIDFDFCEIEPATISGYVYHDANNDGQFASVEAPIANVEIILFDGLGREIARTHSNDQGQYEFRNLRPENYTIRETQPSGWRDGRDTLGTVDGQSAGALAPTGDQFDSVRLYTSSEGVHYNFGELLPASLAGSVHYATPDGDCFGTDVHHSPLADVLVRLLDDRGQWVAETRTNAAGQYQFNDLLPGNYSIEEITPVGVIDGGAQAGTVNGRSVGRVEGTSRITQVTIASGEAGLRYDFCEFAPASLEGYVWHDRNNDGIRQASEDPIAGVTLQLMDEAGQQRLAATTDTAGRYRFDRLTAGTWRIVEVQPPTFEDGIDSAGQIAGGTVGEAVNPGDEIRNIRLRWGDRGIDYRFGEFRRASVEGYVHLSTESGDCFGTAARERPLADVLVRLLNSGGEVVAETTTNRQGHYVFQGLLPGTYSLVEITPAQVVDGAAQAGTVQRIPVGRVEGSSRIVDIVLSSGDAAVDYDFCEHLPASLAGEVYHDRNDNGLRESGEEPIAGVTVRLVDPSGNERTAVTDLQGQYRFTELSAGRYRLLETQPSGWIDGLDSAGLIAGSVVGRALNPGDAIEDISLGWGQHGVEYRFGEILLASLSGAIHADADGDCIRDAEEPPLENVLVDLLDRTGRVVASVRTNAQGEFQFSGIRPGTYTVREHQPQGYFQGGQRAGNGGGDASQTDTIRGIVIRSGDRLVDYTFCEVLPVRLTGYVYQDGPAVELEVNGQDPRPPLDGHDGRRTDDDTPLAGVRLELRDGITGEAVTHASALPGTYPEGPLRAVTDSLGHYQFLHLSPGSYTVIEVQPEGVLLLDWLDTAGTTGGVAINPGDRIEGIRLSPGLDSAENNFSELRIVRRNVVFPEPPPPIPPARPIPLRTVEAPLPPRPVLPLVNPPAREVPPPRYIGFTWHLSVTNAGYPRNVSGADESVLASADEHRQRGANEPRWQYVGWRPQRMSEGIWEQVWLSEGQKRRLRTVRFGARGATPVAGDFNGDGIDELGLFAQGEWWIDLNANGQWDNEDLWARLGYKEDLPVVGDWDGDGKDDIGIFGRAWPGDPRAVVSEPGLPDEQNNLPGRPKNLPPLRHEAAHGRRTLQNLATGALRADLIDHVFHYGAPGDAPVTGDWNRDGIHSIGIFRNGFWRLDVNADGRWTEDDAGFPFGARGDRPIVGDWNGDGITDVGVYRDGQFILDSNGNRRQDSHDQVIGTQAAGGHPVVGDWDGDGRDDVAVYQRMSQSMLRSAEQAPTAGSTEMK